MIELELTQIKLSLIPNQSYKHSYSFLLIGRRGISGWNSTIREMPKSVYKIVGWANSRYPVKNSYKIQFTCDPFHSIGIQTTYVWLNLLLWKNGSDFVYTVSILNVLNSMGLKFDFDDLIEYLRRATSTKYKAYQTNISPAIADLSYHNRIIWRTIIQQNWKNSINIVYKASCM